MNEKQLAWQTVCLFTKIRFGKYSTYSVRKV